MQEKGLPFRLPLYVKIEKILYINGHECLALIGLLKLFLRNYNWIDSRVMWAQFKLLSMLGQLKKSMLKMLNFQISSILFRFMTFKTYFSKKTHFFRRVV